MNVHIFDSCRHRCFAYEISNISDIIPKVNETVSNKDYVFSVERQLNGYFAQGGVIYRGEDETFSDYIERIF